MVVLQDMFASTRRAQAPIFLSHNGRLASRRQTRFLDGDGKGRLETSFQNYVSFHLLRLCVCVCACACVCERMVNDMTRYVSRVILIFRDTNLCDYKTHAGTTVAFTDLRKKTKKERMKARCV